MKPPVSSAAFKWQRPLVALADKLRAAGPGAKVRLVIGRKRDYLLVVDKDGRPVE